VVRIESLGTDETSLLCASCLRKIGAWLEVAEIEYSVLLEKGVDERMAQRVVGARIDRKEV